MTYSGDEVFPALSDEQWARLRAYGSAQEVESGALLWGAGEATYDLILVDSGEAEVARAATARAAEAVVPVSARASSSESWACSPGRRHIRQEGDGHASFSWQAGPGSWGGGWCRSSWPGATR